MNQREKEEYLREYAVLKAQGKPFFPYIIVKDGVMMIVVIGTIMLLSLLLGGELTAKADATTTTYAPRPEWYYFWAFELLRVVKPPYLVGLATVGIPTISILLLILLPFYDRNPERHPLRRPIATTTGIFLIGAMFFLSYLGAEAGAPSRIELGPPPAIQEADQATQTKWDLGRKLVAQSSCGGCHKIGENGNDGPGPPLTEIGDRLKEGAIRETLINPTAPMPSFADLGADQIDKMAFFLSSLKSGGEDEGASATGAEGGGAESEGGSAPSKAP
ncbi:c-type cytochrome [Patulibacter sp.]|uniref:c-type cytochrome n=1 Tax=Patulibacter sp. TaxID=1912859 RepID=UPI0027211C12|nr:c-type cytochrome [Patulibacter sp.]MDO9410156.1 c-type cytochrome [Patulibacter sp.]